MNLEKRIVTHNGGKVKSTRFRRPLRLVYSEFFKSLSEARKKEWALKYTPWGGKLKKLLVSKAAGSSNGRIHGSEPWNLGSIPSPAALDSRKRHKFT